MSRKHEGLTRFFEWRELSRIPRAVLKLIDEVDDKKYFAKLALYAREKAFMKDMPAALLVALSVCDTELMHRVFDRVVDNDRILRTAEFGKPAARHSLVEIAEACRREADACTIDDLAIHPAIRPYFGHEGRIFRRPLFDDVAPARKSSSTKCAKTIQLIKNPGNTAFFAGILET